MSRPRTVKHAWIWKKDGSSFKATLSGGVLKVKRKEAVDERYTLILVIDNLTLDSQKKIIKNLHRVKFSVECDT